MLSRPSTLGQQHSITLHVQGSLKRRQSLKIEKYSLSNTVMIGKIFKCFFLSFSLSLAHSPSVFYLKCNFPLAPHVRWLFGWLNGLWVKLPYSYRSTCRLLSLYEVYIFNALILKLQQ